MSGNRRESVGRRIKDHKMRISRVVGNVAAGKKYPSTNVVPEQKMAYDDAAFGVSVLLTWPHMFGAMICVIRNKEDAAIRQQGRRTMIEIQEHCPGLRDLPA
jgi:hypothetical protein